jgi:hypothetical protein
MDESANPVLNKWGVGRQFANGGVTTNDAASAPRQAVLVAQPEWAHVVWSGVVSCGLVRFRGREADDVMRGAAAFSLHQQPRVHDNDASGIPAHVGKPHRLGPS